MLRLTNTLSVIFCFLSVFAAQADSINQCVFAHKDYDSAGFSVPSRKGFKISGQFGCVYVCQCQCQGQEYKITHVLRESHFDIEYFSEDTGGPKRARWFICPLSVKPETWTPKYDEVGRVAFYQVEPEDRPFSAQKSGISEIENFCK